VLDEHFAHPVPDTLSYDEAALIEPLSVAVAAVQKCPHILGANVLVTGAGPIGVLCAQMARAAGATTVAIIDINKDRLAQALALSADTALESPAQAELDELQADVLVECTGRDEVVAQGIAALQPAGTAVLVGMGPTAAQSVPTAILQMRELTITGVFRYANTYRLAIALAAAGRVKLSGLVGARFPLADADRALQMSHTNPSVLKTMVDV
jgi:L-iditol 2-dehydrogenase